VLDFIETSSKDQIGYYQYALYMLWKNFMQL